MLARAMAWIGGLGAGTTLLCCFTSLLPAVLGALGLTSLLSAVYRDDVLFPLAAVFLVIMVVGLYLRRGRV